MSFCLAFGLYDTISPSFCCIFVESFNAVGIANQFSIDIRFEISTSPSGLQKVFLIPFRFFFYFMFRFLLDFFCSAKLPKNSSIIRAFENSFIRKRLKALNLFIPTLSPMWGCLSVLNHIRVAKQSWPPSPPGLTKINNKNEWNTSMCSSSTLAINRSTSLI